MANTTNRAVRQRLTVTAALAVLGLIALVTGTTGVWTPGRLGVPETGGTVPGLFLNYQQLMGAILIAISALLGTYALGLSRQHSSASR